MMHLKETIIGIALTASALSSTVAVAADKQFVDHLVQTTLNRPVVTTEGHGISGGPVVIGSPEYEYVGAFKVACASQTTRAHEKNGKTKENSLKECSVFKEKGKNLPNITIQ